MQVSIEDLARKTSNDRALCLAQALDVANGVFLENDKSPLRDAGQLDNRGSHFYLALYWAQALAAQTADATLQARFRPLAQRLTSSEARIVAELNAAQGTRVDIGGYYHADPAKCAAAMRPSPLFNEILGSL